MFVALSLSVSFPVRRACHRPNRTLTDTRPIGNQHHPHERLFSSAFDFYSDRHSHLSGHHADMQLFTKHSLCHHHGVLGFFVVIAMLYTSIGIGIGYWYRYRAILLGIGYWVPFLVSF